jgi:hypothetical protein
VSGHGQHQSTIAQFLRKFLTENVQTLVDASFSRIARGNQVLWQALPTPKLKTDARGSAHIGAVLPDGVTIHMTGAGVISAGAVAGGTGSGLPDPTAKGNILRANLDNSGALYWEQYPIGQEGTALMSHLGLPVWAIAAGVQWVIPPPETVNPALDIYSEVRDDLSSQADGGNHHQAWLFLDDYGQPLAHDAAYAQHDIQSLGPWGSYGYDDSLWGGPQNDDWAALDSAVYHRNPCALPGRAKFVRAQFAGGNDQGAINLARRCFFLTGTPLNPRLQVTSRDGVVLWVLLNGVVLLGKKDSSDPPGFTPLPLSPTPPSYPATNAPPVTVPIPDGVWRDGNNILAIATMGGPLAFSLTSDAYSAPGGGGTWTGISGSVKDWAAKLHAAALAAGVPISAAVFAVWAQRETGGTVVNNNPLNIRNAKTDPNLYDNGMDMDWPGPFAKFDSQDDGVAAMVAEILNGPNWSGIRAAAAESPASDHDVIEAIESSHWEETHYGGDDSLWSNYQQWIGGGGRTSAAVAAFVAAHVGTTISDGGTQCVALANTYMDEVLHTPNTVSWGVGSAWQMFDKAKISPQSDHWTAIANTPDAVPESGDLIIWSSAVGGGDGHVALCVSADLTVLHTFDQNYGTPADAELQTHGYSNVRGWIRFTG